MRQVHVALLLSGLSVMDAGAAAPQDVPPTATISQARVAWTFNAARLCPGLQASEDGGGAVVLFRVGRTGSPSHVAIRSSSRSAELDEAALQCVQRLRFQPATRLGDGESIDSWQQMAWMWAPQPRGNAGVRGEVPPPETAAKMEPKSEGRVTVRGCAGQDGQMSQDPVIVHSSGKPQLDEAALQIARLGAAYFPQHDAGEGRKLGCAQLVIDFSLR